MLHDLRRHNVPVNTFKCHERNQDRYLTGADPGGGFWGS